ncbi:cytochrome P450 [Xylariaceae sp. FL1019]|nr:cytochrome P450 [Xylariaceae sp. FL1019]
MQPLAMPASFPISTIGLVCLVVVIIGVIVKNAGKRPLPGIPYNERALRSFMGDMGELSERQRAGDTSVRPWFLEQAARHKSALVQIFLGPFAGPTLLLSDYREVSDILTHRDSDFKRGDKKIDVFRGLIPHAFPAMESYHPSFRESRGLTMGLMAPSFLKKVSSPKIYNCSSRLVELWQLKSSMSQGRPFDVVSDIGCFAFDAIMGTAIGLAESDGNIDRQLSHLQRLSVSQPAWSGADDHEMSVTFPSAGSSQELRALLVNEQSLWKGFYVPWPRLYHFVDKLRPTVRDANRIIQAYFDKWTRTAISRLKHGKDPQTAFEFIIQRQIDVSSDSAVEATVNDPRIRDSVYSYLIAGHDTSAGSLIWLIRRLVSHPEEQEKIRTSLRKTYTAAHEQKRVPSADELAKTAPYLDAYIEEVLRCNCPVSTVALTTRRDTLILGHPVAKDTPVFLNLTGPSLNMPSVHVEESHRSPTCQARKGMRANWDDEDPTAFRPERWLRTNDDGEVVFSRVAGPFLSLSAGDRGCWGRKLGYLELRILLTLLVWSFEFHTLPSELETWELHDSLATAPKQCYVRLSPI